MATRKRSALHLSQALGHDAADKRIDILRRIGEAGSISEAARGAGVSYKAAWQAIETLSNLAGQALVEKVVGGSGGGGAQLSAAGRRVLEAADLLARSRAAVLESLEQQGGAVDALGLAGLGLRTSMRNQLPCAVQSLERSGGGVRVALELPDGSLLRSRITRESAELLALRAGLPVIALCKATAVAVAATLRPRPGANLLTGEVARLSASEADAEVSLLLMPGRRLVGFASAGAALKTGQRAMAAIDESAVVIASGS